MSGYDITSSVSIEKPARNQTLVTGQYMGSCYNVLEKIVSLFSVFFNAHNFQMFSNYLVCKNNHIIQFYIHFRAIYS